MKKGKIIFESRNKSLTPFIHAIHTYTQELEDACLADKIVGRAAALLAVYAKIHSVYAVTLSSEAAKVLEHYKIKYRFGNIVERIVNYEGTDLCPFEKIIYNTNNPTEAFKCIEDKIQDISTRQ